MTGKNRKKWLTKPDWGVYFMIIILVGVIIILFIQATTPPVRNEFISVYDYNYLPRV